MILSDYTWIRQKIMSIAKKFFTKEIIEDLKVNVSIDFIKEITSLLNLKMEFKNYKINTVYTTSNLQVDNPERRISPKSKSTLIIGSSGIGKTTFFDKLVHPIVFPYSIYSPINGYVTGLKIHYSSEEDDLEFKFTTTIPNKINITINGEQSSENSDIAKSFGLYASFLTSFFFICGQIDHFHLFSHFNGNINQYKRYFYHPIDLSVISLFDSAIKDYKLKIEEIKNKIYTLSYSNNQLNSFISKANKEIQEYQLFLDNKNEIKALLEKLRSEIEHKELNFELREIRNRLRIINYKITTENQILSDIEENSISPKYSTEYHRFLREEYQDSPKTCFNCNKDFTFPHFVKKYESNKCFICNNNYNGYEEFTGEKFQPNMKKKGKQDGLLKFILEKSPLEDKKKEILKKIQSIEEKKLSDEELSLKKIMSPFFFEIKYNNFEEMIKKFVSSQLSRRELVIEYSDRIKKSKEKLKEISTNLHKLEDIRNFIAKYKQDFLILLESDIEDTFTLFSSKISEFWHLLSKISDKIIEEKDGQLFVVSVSKKSLLPVSTKITGLDPKQRRLSTNLVEILRYSLQLAFIYCLSQKFQKIPIKTIIFDDPNQKYIKSLIKLLNSVFVKNLGFQIILLTHVENIETDWKIEEFDFYDGNMTTEDEKFNHIIDEWKKGDSQSKNEEENETGENVND
ncbi:hypothetical protein [Candidatus Lokiarchaeum ossiferum]|uniref:hypothetical protein n=1 Tax=Candidatus Lokiarchaeum ossiferum TaxID=2951803 RepID=UPI00352DFA1B